MNIPNNLNFATSHEWARLEADGTVTMGISDVAQDMLGDIVFCGEAKVGEMLAAGETCAVVESVKAASDIYMPVAGEVLAFNEALDADPAVMNTTPYEAWVLKIKPSNPADVAALMDSAAYQATIA